MSALLIMVTATKIATTHMVPITAHVAVDGVWILMDTLAMVIFFKSVCSYASN